MINNEWKFPCKAIKNYDGDTFTLELDLGFGISRVDSVRIMGVDTPEVRGGTIETKAAARLAKDEAAEFVANGENIYWISIEWAGKYGRPLGDIEVDGKLLTEFLLDNRLAAPYDGGNRAELKAVHAENLHYLMESGKLDEYLN